MSGRCMSVWRRWGWKQVWVIGLRAGEVAAASLRSWEAGEKVLEGQASEPNPYAEPCSDSTAASPL